MLTFKWVVMHLQRCFHLFTISVSRKYLKDYIWILWDDIISYSQPFASCISQWLCQESLFHHSKNKVYFFPWNVFIIMHIFSILIINGLSYFQRRHIPHGQLPCLTCGLHPASWETFICHSIWMHYLTFLFVKQEWGTYTRIFSMNIQSSNDSYLLYHHHHHHHYWELVPLISLIIIFAKSTFLSIFLAVYNS
jgi:hypothetical protein